MAAEKVEARRLPQRAVKTRPNPPMGGDTFWGTSTAAMETNDLGFVASLLFVLVPAVFLIILYIQTSSRQGN
jgi:photosystem II PsbM protein